MRLGICGCMIDPEGDPIGINIVEDCASMGWDYIELSLRDVAALSDREFASLRRRLEKSGLVCEACNNFYPPEQRITGPAVDFAALTAYTRKALGRARDLGSEFVVFGSSGARNIPEGFPRDRAWEQILSATRMIGDIAAGLRVVSAIEYHNKAEANVLNSMDEAVRLCDEAAHPAVRVLTDYFHFAYEKESLDALRLGGRRIVHGHFSELDPRIFPSEPRAEYKAYFKTLAEIGYTGRTSVEAYTKDFRKDAEKALGVLRELTAS